MTNKLGAVRVKPPYAGYTPNSTKNHRTTKLITGLAILTIIATALLIGHYTSIGRVLETKITALSKAALPFLQAHLKAIAASTFAVGVLSFGLGRRISDKYQHSDDIITHNLTKGKHPVVEDRTKDDGSDDETNFATKVNLLLFVVWNASRQRKEPLPRPHSSDMYQGD